MKKTMTSDAEMDSYNGGDAISRVEICLERTIGCPVQNAPSCHNCVTRTSVNGGGGGGSSSSRRESGVCDSGYAGEMMTSVECDRCVVRGATTRSRTKSATQGIIYFQHKVGIRSCVALVFMRRPRAAAVSITKSSFELLDDHRLLSGTRSSPHALGKGCIKIVKRVDT
jgi:hypothetical protein